MRVGHAFRFYDQKTLEGVYNFLNLLPLIGILTHLLKIPTKDLINPLILLNEYQ